MSRFFFFVLLVLSLTVPAQLFAAVPRDKTITLNLPESVLSQAIGEMLPFDIDPASSSLRGSITIVSIDDLKVTEQNISCRLKLSGKKLQIVTELSGHQISMKVGAIELNFNCSTKLRFDSAKQTLYIRPMINDISAPKSSTTDIGGTLLPLLNGHEFPITMQDLAPLVAKTDDKTVAITMHISDIRAVNGALQLSLTPRVSSTQHPSSPKGKRPDNS
jgi:hypothetical protein